MKKSRQFKDVLFERCAEAQNYCDLLRKGGLLCSHSTYVRACARSIALHDLIIELGLLSDYIHSSVYFSFFDKDEDGDCDGDY